MNFTETLCKNTAAAHTCTLDCSGWYSCSSASVEGPGRWVPISTDCAADYGCRFARLELDEGFGACSDGGCLLACSGADACKYSTFACPAAQCLPMKTSKYNSYIYYFILEIGHEIHLFYKIGRVEEAV